MKFFLVSLFGISLLVALVPHVVYLVAKLFSLVFHVKCSYRPYGIASLALVALWILLAVYGNRWGRFFHETKQVELQFPQLPESFDGYRIVHISDLHLDGWRGHADKLQAIVDEINALRADAIVFTGDAVSLSDSELEPFVPVLRQLKAADGVFSILGNHDYLPYNRSFTPREREARVQHVCDLETRALGWRLLRNENVTLRRGEDSIAIAGSENQSMGIHSVVTRGDLKKALAGTDSIFRILLTHDPTHWRGEVLAHDVPLTLSGHTHGGQMSVLGLVYASAFIYREHAGLYSDAGRYLYVNLGLGATMPMRLGATPEITLITIKRR